MIRSAFQAENYPKPFFDFFDIIFLIIVIGAPVQIFCFPAPFNIISLGLALSGILFLPAMLLLIKLFQTPKKSELVFKLWLVCSGILLGLQIISLSYSPMISSGGGGIISYMAFLFLVIYGYCRFEKLREKFVKNLIILFILFSIEAVLMLLFRYRPDWEWDFWHSSYNTLVLNPKRDYANSNLTDTLRGGGFFETAQSAAIVMMYALGYLWLSLSSKIKIYQLILMTLFCGAMAATAGKFVIILSLILMLSGIVAVKKLRFFLLFNFVILLFSTYFIFAINCTYSHNYAPASQTVEVAADELSATIITADTKADVHEKQKNETQAAIINMLMGQNRSNLWKIGGTAILEHPFLGVGYGGFEKYYFSSRGSWSKEFGERNPNPHNIYLLTYLRSGVLAFLLLSAAIPLLFFYILYRAWPNREKRDKLWVCGGIIICMISCGLTEDLYYWGRSEYMTALLAPFVVLLFKTAQAARTDQK